MDREWLADILSKTEAIVTFMKKDGTLRVMQCTLKSEYLPALKGSNHKRSDEVLPVWDIEKSAWRSFRLDSIEKVEVDGENLI